MPAMIDVIQLRIHIRKTNGINQGVTQNVKLDNKFLGKTYTHTHERRVMHIQLMAAKANMQILQITKHMYEQAVYDNIYRVSFSAIKLAVS